MKNTFYQVFFGISMALCVFVAGIFFSNLYIQQDKNEGFSFTQNLYDSSKILPDSFVSTPRFFASNQLSTKTKLSEEEKEKITRTFNDIIILASKNKICTGGSYSLEPTFHYDYKSGKQTQKGYSFNASFNCEINTNQLEEYKELISSMSKIASLSGLISMNVPSLNATISNELLRKSEEESINKILTLANESSIRYSKSINYKCKIKNINFSSRQIRPAPRVLTEKSNTASFDKFDKIVGTVNNIGPVLPVIDEENMEKSALVTFYCEK